MTRLPSSADTQASKRPSKGDAPIEYSARELSPPALLLQQILRAHRVFLLHQGFSIAELYNRVPRQKFCSFLKRFWDKFIRGWDVLLHGNPAVDVFNGLKLSAGGELGIGEGEEDWGSGEREVLEGFLGKTKGLVDLVVCRFGDPRSQRRKVGGLSPSTTGIIGSSAGQLDAGEEPGPSDGVIFSGIGALTRSSIRNVSIWVEWLAMYGRDTYGVRDNPSSNPRRQRKKDRGGADPSGHSPNIPAPIVGPRKLRETINPSHSKTSKGPEDVSDKGNTEQDVAASTEIMKYLTLGVYGSSWGIPSGRPATNQRVSSLRQEGDSQVIKSGYSVSSQEQEESGGHFLVGLLEDLEEDGEDEAEEDPETGPDNGGQAEAKTFNSRIIMRHVYIERLKEKLSGEYNDPPVDQVYYDRLRVIVYVQQPFIFTFLFEQQTDALAIPSFYRSLHHQFGPLQRPLLTSTSPKKISERLWAAASPKSTAPNKSSQPIWDLVYDPARLTVHTTIPNIPDPGTGPADSPTGWTRIESLSVHSQILNTHASTRRHTSELEQTCKTNRGWWVVWMRLPHPMNISYAHSDSYREAFLIRKASDYIAPTTRNTSRFGRDVSGPSTGGGWGPTKLAEGIGIDARQYVDGLLSLNR